MDVERNNSGANFTKNVKKRGKNSKANQPQAKRRRKEQNAQDRNNNNSNKPSREQGANNQKKNNSSHSERNQNSSGVARKRRKNQASSKPSPVPSDAPSPLSAFTARRPIIVHLRPLRRSQSEIIARALRSFGATVYLSSLPFSERKLLSESAVIVTDLPTASREAFPSAPHFVSVAWASDAARTGIAPAPEQYAVEIPTLSENPAPTQPVEVPPPPPPHRSAPAPPQSLPLASYPSWIQNVPPDAPHRLGRYACMRSVLTRAIFTPPNSRLADTLRALARARALDISPSAEMRSRAYARAASVADSLPWKIQSAADLRELPEFGDRVAAVVNEYFQAADLLLPELAQLQRDKRITALQELTKCYGVGPATARALYEDGVRDTCELQARIDSGSLGNLGNKIYVPLGKPVSRAIAERMMSAVRQHAAQANLRLRFVLCGGLRRGEPTGHDVDVLYCRVGKDRSETASVLKEIAEVLEKSGILKRALSLQSDVNGWGEMRYRKQEAKGRYELGHDILHAVCQFEGVQFRTDFVGIRDYKEMPFATVAWSGSVAFQKDIRLFAAEQRGWIFNQHGVFDQHTKQRVTFRHPVETEHDVFHVLGLPYRPPYERSC